MKPPFPATRGTQVHAVLLAIDFGDGGMDARLAEARELITTAGASVAAVMTAKRSRPDAATFAGSGKVAELAEMVYASRASLVVVDHQLSPIQLRNLERAIEAARAATDADESTATALQAPHALSVRVIDRTDLILDIFAQRARSAEGRLQVELAQMQHLLTRLVKGWTHLERQRGGIGVRGGPGESQLELDRRLIGERIKRLKERLSKLERQRSTQRAARRRSGTFSVSIVGYTNAGKSTLFNRLARADSYVADQLFATLDTTTRKLFIAPHTHLALSDTVGFIRDLPHGLVSAFHATLTESLEADLLLHVVDASNPAWEQQIADVEKVLAEIGAAHIPQLVAFNKIDRLLADGSAPLASVVRDETGRIRLVRLSAATGDGVESLRSALQERSIDLGGVDVLHGAPTLLSADPDAAMLLTDSA